MLLKLLTATSTAVPLLIFMILCGLLKTLPRLLIGLFLDALWRTSVVFLRLKISGGFAVSGSPVLDVSYLGAHPENCPFPFSSDVDCEGDPHSDNMSYDDFVQLNREMNPNAHVVCAEDEEFHEL